MAGWFRKIMSDPDNYETISAAFDYFEKELEDARADLSVSGKRIYEVSGKIAGMAEYRYAQCKEIEAIIDLLELKQKKLVQAARKKYTEHYARELNATTIEKYAEADASVVDLCEFIVLMKLLEKQYHGVTKGIEILHYQLKNLTTLRTAGIEDATI